MNDQSCFTCAKREGTRCGETRLMVLADSGHHCRRYEARNREQCNNAAGTEVPGVRRIEGHIEERPDGAEAGECIGGGTYPPGAEPLKVALLSEVGATELAFTDAVLTAVEALHQSADRYRSELGLLKLAHALNLSSTLITSLESDVADRRREFKAACAAFDAALEAES